MKYATYKNNNSVTRYMDDGEFQSASFPILAREIFEAIHAAQPPKDVA